MLYLPDFRLPDKALDLVDQACAQVRFARAAPFEPEKDDYLTEKFVEIVVRADPEPDDGVTFAFRKSAEGVVDADGPNAVLPSQFFKTQ